MDESADAPGTDAIRRALAECMTLADIDDAMGWAAGTARRRRWRGHAEGGLPPADAELGGVPLWFRATVVAWARPAEPTTGPEALATAEPATGEAGEAGEAGAVGAVGEAGEAGAVEAGAVEPDPAPAPAAEPEPGAEPDVEAEPAPDAAAVADTADATEGATVATGFTLAPGQQVLAFVHGGWHAAVVVSRARRTVVLDYQLVPGPLGARRQRVAVERVRLPGPGS